VLLPVLATLAVAWFTALVTAPVMAAHASAAVYLVGSFICHQLPDRSFHVAGSQLPVCARCLGIYAGITVVAALGCVAWVREPLRRWPAARFRWFAAIAALPTVVTVVAEWGGGWATSNAVRAIAGASLGMGAALVVVGAVASAPRSAAKPTL
jgi:uncharacterized membrane protein